MDKFWVIYDLNGYSSPHYAWNEAPGFDTLEEALDFVSENAADTGNDPCDYSIWSGKPVRVALTI